MRNKLTEYDMRKHLALGAALALGFGTQAFAAEAAGFITGETLSINGGQYME